ncbi:MFS transporter [Paenibacillus sp. GSMTC-2017]|uniref:MFS transporter n=1 Tax=Paenibacillus sp. GSMTC-2017 TaxID=2794350 RepID=UPI0018D73126|nr:MFS transporter [Paenibacillus sp. GSMTC-2017]MBH5320524.1 MFS transporter [Paenibacillus sp. GSMTC-2017]
MKRLLWIGCLSYLVIGLAHVIGGSVLEQLIEHYGVTYKDGGQWIMNQFLGFLVGVLFAPALSSRIGKRGAVLAAMGLLALSQAAYSLLLPWGWMLAFAPIAGVGFGMTEAIVGAMIIDLMKGKASAMSKLETFFGLGALIIPITTAYLIGQHIWQLSFPILAAMSGIAFVMWLTISFGNLDEQIGLPPNDGRIGNERNGAERNTLVPGISENITTNKGSLIGYPNKSVPFLALCALFFMMYVGMEMSFSNYLPSILITRTGMSESGATAALSIFWGAVVVGRLFAGILAEKLGYAKYLLLTTIGAVLVFGLLVVIEEQGWMLVLIASSGLCFSGIFGIALVYANGLLPGMTERTTSLLVAFGGIGGALFPRITGWMMDRYHVQSTLWYIGVLVTCMLLILIMMLLLGKAQSRRSLLQE